jgi:hypothetical protein
MVPVVGENLVLGTDIPIDIDPLVAYATRNSIQTPSVKLEGLVFRPMVETIDPEFSSVLHGGGRISFKVINPEYLLKHGE